MKKALYIYLSLVSSSVCAMQQVKKNQLPVNKKPLITKQEMVGATLIASPFAHTALTSVCYIVAPELSLGMTVIEALKVGSTTMGTAMILDAREQKQKQNNEITAQLNN
jgi:hypothetical protein